jgi:hypothetical protein
MVSWTGDGAGGTITVDLTNPEDESQSASVRIPRNVLAPGERGVLIFSIACDLVSLLGEDVAAATGDVSADRPDGFAYFEISILVSADGGATFSELDNEVVADLPIEITLNGLTFTPGQAQTFSSHSTGVSPTDSSITAETDDWSSESIFGAVGSGGTISASTSSLSVFVPVENNPLGPTLSVEPNPGYDQLFGIVQLGQTVTDTVVIKNVGSGTVTGTATLTDPAGVFGVVGTTSYSLKEDESATLTVSFAPDAEGDFTGTLTLSGAVNSPINVTLKGTGSTQVKNISLFGCAPGAGGAGSASGDFAVVLLALGALALGTQMHRRTRRQN